MPAKIINTTKNTVLAERAEIANTFWLRLKGLLGKRQLEPNTGLILNPCNSIHTFFMRFPIDAAFVDSQNKIIKAYYALPAWRASGMFFNSSLCIEFPSGTLLTSGTEIGDYIRISPSSA
ncbi:DUF192 domain-containing protein [bacterium]|nr:MAG: DUF192 domain-containing protein [bacterium]